MNELDAARQIRDGLLPSPFSLGAMTLFALRITGTGLSYRSGRDEFVWRDSSLYLNDEFLARCNGLPVIWDHPPKKTQIDSQEFAQRVIGTVMLPYIKEDAVWGICRVYDTDAIKLMTDGQLSTSPAVVFSHADGNKTVKLNGETFLIEGTPYWLDHLAVCEAGVWDQGGPPTGVQNDTLTKEPRMADDTEAERKAREEREDKARKDAAEMMDRIDASLKRMDARMDAMEADKARKDSEDKEREDKARHDAARKDRFGHRKDGEARKDWKARHDADEMAMCDALAKGGVEMDKARKDARDCRMDAEKEEAEHGGESFAKWAKEEENEESHADRARRDAEEAKKREDEERERADKARHDATARENTDLKARLATFEATLKGLTAEVTPDEREALATAQSRADSVAAMFGDRAPVPMSGETSIDYRKRVLKRFQPHSPQFKESRFDSLDGAMLKPIEDIVYHDSINAAKGPAQVKAGLLVPEVRPDAAGRQITRYHGDPMAWMQHFCTGAQIGRIVRPQNKGI